MWGEREQAIHCRNELLSLNIGLLVMHSLYLREIADGSRHAIAKKQNLHRLLRSACLYSTVSPCVGILTLQLPSDVATNTTAIPCTIGVHTLTVFLGCVYKRYLLNSTWS